MKLIKKYMILHGFPIEYICLQTNLLNLVKTITSTTLSKHWEDIAFSYIEVLKKYVPSALGCVL